MLAMAKLAGYVSRSKKEIKACNMVFYFLVGNVFFLSLLSGTLLDQIGQSFTHPKDFPSRLASAVSAQVRLFTFTGSLYCVPFLCILAVIVIFSSTYKKDDGMMPMWRAYETCTSFPLGYCLDTRSMIT